MIVKKKTTVEFLNESEKASLYSISFEMDGTTEFEKFVAEFEMNATYNRDYQRIIAALQAILRIGALERFFRPEGDMNDGVQAIPIESGKLRLYCLRLSDQIVILGNGGVKNTRTYEENPKLYGYVLDLQKFEKILNETPTGVADKLIFDMTDTIYISSLGLRVMMVAASLMKKEQKRFLLRNVDDYCRTILRTMGLIDMFVIE